MIDSAKPDPVEKLVASVRDSHEVSSEDINAVLELLRTWLSRRGLSTTDLEEVSSDAVMRLIRSAGEGRLDPTRPAGAWLRVVADHLAIDALRRSQRRSDVAFEEIRHVVGHDDDRLAALLDRSAAATDVRLALREAARDGRQDIVRVVATWIGLADANGVAPSSREVAERLGISHMTVQRALNSFGERLSGR